jgi:serine/threonine-protein kinase RsbW
MSNSKSVPESSSAPESPVVHVFDSSLESVDAAEESVIKFADQLGFSEDDQHGIGMAVRESMVNAVVHGNRYSADRKVHMTVDIVQGALRVQIRDEGEGFDQQRVADPTAPQNLLRQSGRGMLLIRAFVDECTVERAESKGTQITLIKKMAS